MKELKMLKEKFGFDHIWFCDDIFGLKPGWVHEFANLVEEEQLKFQIQDTGQGRSAVAGKLYQGPGTSRL